MSGRVVHFEIPFDDGDRASKFYEDVFGWQIMQLPEMEYTLVTTGPADPETGPTEPGYINGGMFARTPDFPSTSPNLVVGVDDIDEALKKAEAAGGTIVNQKMAVGEIGFSGYFRDTEGNVIGLWENAR